MVKRKKSTDSDTKETFKWTDDEAELLLKVTHDYKVAKESEGADWESIQSKYGDILERMLSEYPATQEAAKELQKDYPHKKTEITKAILTTKLKLIRIKFRQAVDSGRKSGHGRVVLLYFELCEHIWGGSPATEQMPFGVESHDVARNDEDAGSTSDTMSIQSSSTSETISTPASLNSSVDDDDSEATKSTEDPTVKQRRDLLGAQLSSYKQEKLKRKLPVDAQLLNCAKEDVSLKKKLVDQMDQMDRLHNEHMQKLSNNMEKLTSSITAGFSLIQGLLYPPPPVQPMYQQTGLSYNPTQQGPFSPMSQATTMRGPFCESTVDQEHYPQHYHKSDQ